MKDGDLWQLFDRTVASKTPNAITMTKVKGHATMEMVDKGEVVAEEKDGNDEADYAAEKGAKGMQENLKHMGWK